MSFLRSYDAFKGPPFAFMTSSKTSVVLSVTTWFLMVQLCLGQHRALLGTTPNIKHIVVGRCYNYITLINATSRHDCEDIWRHFEEAVVRQSSCNVTMEDYHHMFRAMTQTWPCNRFLFWSKTRTLMHSYAAVMRHFWTLEDTLVGYMFNDLIWCGRERDSGFDFSACPEWSACRNHPVYSLWKLASQNFAEMACGNITVLLNGSIHHAFSRKSMFGSVELDYLNPQRVDYVNIKVVTSLEGPSVESCHQGSVVDLIQILQARGFRWTCTDNDQTLMILQCIQKSRQSSYQTCINSLFLRENPVSN
ncbi:ADP-ribosyl cyclase/cyclic ADP-ribose hydrolase 1-like [Sphaeramia orbicularis]|uniref:ADP-ribosyl cyclase/cyclic ADP-ribose hydrolase 1-like n=1 Tax=Sphaeramia orbicularis TaxID=375764 RepID=UPI00117C94CC|nr:ADP-ribosyl cyclase/cyclic ADP-ribose hydrolase 1-like [Sphaeramia orbicularis]XP_029978922.1 ADP-ribosyl cyclase/cyclic ADP-ribose hydrolase 1-like [Sphaeramia orbicularis]